MASNTTNDIDSNNLPTHSGNFLVITHGPHPGAKVALDTPTTILGDNGKRIISIRQADFGYLVKAEDPTILVTHNGDPLPPVAKPVQNHDVLRFSDLELICCIGEPSGMEVN